VHKRNEEALLLQGKWGTLLRETFGTLLFVVVGEWENIVAF
jgi:hypothetical protein